MTNLMNFLELPLSTFVITIIPLAFYYVGLYIVTVFKSF